MKKLILAGLLSGVLANAGIVKVVTYPVRHPVKLVKTTVRVTKAILW